MKCTWKKYLCTLLIPGLVFLLVNDVTAAEESNAEPVTAAKSTKVKKKKKEQLGIGFSLGYGIRTDIANEVQPRSYKHSLSGGVSYSFKDKLSVSADTSFVYSSLNEKIETGEGQYGLGDFDVGISKGIKLGNKFGGKHSLGLSFSNTFPLSNDTQVEGVDAVPNIGAGVKSVFFDGLYSIKNSVSYHYIFNTFTHSPTTGIVNKRHGASYKMGHAIRIWKGFKLGISLGLRVSWFVDGSEQTSYTNNIGQSIGYSFGNLTVGVKHSNGGYTPYGDAVDLWYIDKYRRIVSGSVSYSF